MGRKLVIVLCWVSVIAMGAFLRFDQLSARPFHCDEATGARLTAKRMETGASQFDPTHFHGPILSSLAMPLCHWRGEDRWQTLTKGTLRLVPATAGLLTVLLPLLWRRRWGDAPMLLAAALLATSPLLVYYSRMFIHESMVGLFGMLAVMTLLYYPKFGIPGIFIGLMFATKESFVISLIAWAGAAVGVAAWNFRLLRRDPLLAAWREYRLHLLASVVTTVLVSAYFYTDGFRQLHGLADAVKTFFIYKTGEGHDKPFHYYLQFLLLPQKSGGIWWYGTPVGLLALVAVVRSFGRGLPDPRLRATIQFLALAAAAHFVGYGLIAYKTPWLMVLPWAHVCLLAGFALVGFSRQLPPLQAALAVLAGGGYCLTFYWNTCPAYLIWATRAVCFVLAVTASYDRYDRRRWSSAWLQTTLGILVGVCLVTQTHQTWHATGRLDSDERNPFTYVPTRRSIETLEPWLHQLAAAAPGGTLEPIAVIGSGYWPLPWYLRTFETIGYWPAPPAGLDQMPVVLWVPEGGAPVELDLSATHTPLPRGLRANVPLTLFLRNDIWQAWMNGAPQ